MADGFDLGTAWIQITPSMRGFSKSVESELGSIDAVKPANRIGSTITSVIGGAFKLAAVAGVAAFGAITAGVASFIPEAIRASDATDKFKSTLDFAGLGADQIDALTKSAQAYADKTIYDLGDIQSITAQLAANGVEGFDQLAEAAGNLNAVASGNKDTFQSVGMVLTQTAGAGKLTTENWNQLANAIPGASGRLQEAMLQAGAYTGNFRDAMAAGEITAEEFNAALLKLGTEPVAVEAAQSVSTIEGMMGNFQATIVGGLSDAINKYKPQLGEFMGWITDAIGVAIPVVFDFLDNLGKIGGILFAGDFTGPIFGLHEDSALVDFLFNVRDVLVELAGFIGGAFTNAWNFLVGAFQWIAENTTWITPLAVGIGAAAAAWWVWTTAITAWATIVKIGTALQAAFNAVMAANPIMLVVMAIAALVAGLVFFFTQTELGRTIWQGFIDWLGQAWNWLWNSVLKPVFDAIGAAFNWLWTAVIEPVVGFIVAYVQAWGAIFTWLYENVVKPAFDAIGAVFTWLYESIVKPVFDAIGFVISAVWTAVQIYFAAWVWVFQNVLAPVFVWLYENVVKPVWAGIQAAIQVVGDWFQNTLVPAFKSAGDALGAGFTWLYDSIIKPVWDGIKGAIDVVYSWFDSTLVPAFKQATGWIGDAFTNLQKSIETAWNAIKKAAVAPVNFIINTVYNDGIAALFNQIADAVGLDKSIRMPKADPIKLASGGLLPGYTPGRDVHKFYSPTAGQLWLSGGEGIIRPDALRALGGKRWLDAVNGARGGAGKYRNGFRFADGGIWDWVADGIGGAIQWVQDTASAIGDIIADPLGAVRSLILEPVKGLLSDIGGGMFGEILTGIPLKVIDWIGSLFEEKMPKSATVNGYTGGPTLARLLPIIQKYGLVVTDTWGSPEYNASLGRSPNSYHGDRANPAVDIAGSQSAMHAAADEIIAMGGWRQILWQTAGHYDHIHVANRGGIFGDLPFRKYDSGGFLQPGLTLAYNATGKPEPIFTDSQWSMLERGNPRELVVVDADGALIGRMRVESAAVVTRAFEGAGL